MLEWDCLKEFCLVLRNGVLPRVVEVCGLSSRSESSRWDDALDCIDDENNGLRNGVFLFIDCDEDCDDECEDVACDNGLSSSKSVKLIDLPYGEVY